jgi:methyl-accepting chemotaxis protein
MTNFKKMFHFPGNGNNQIAIILGNITKGDLTSTLLSDTGKNEVSDALREMVRFFDGSISSISESTNNISMVIDKISTNAWGMLEGAGDQSNQASQIATASEEMSQTITDIARSCTEASEMSVKAMDIATQGKHTADGTISAFMHVNQSVSDLSSVIGSLNKSVQEIGDIVEIIKDIADQTNLLALNAAIEAARAGEQGRGFAVVADEVRKLAERTIKATSEITGRVVTVQNESNKTAHSMSVTMENINKSTQHIEHMGASLDSITNIVNEVKDRVTQVATAVEEQSAAAEQIAKNVENTALIARSAEDKSTEIMHDANQLIKIEESLRQSVLKFKTDGLSTAMLDIGKTDHRRFVKKILSAITGDLNLDASQLPDHHNCRFGKWYDTEGKEKYGHSHNFSSIISPHERVHAMSKEILTLYKSGNGDRAKELYQELEHLSAEIVKHIDALKSDS